MSAALVRRGLELLQAEDDAAARASTASRKGETKSAGHSVQSIAKRSKNKKLQRKRMRNQPTVKHKSVKSAVEEYKRKQNANPYKKNVQYLLKNQSSSTKKITQKILAQNRGRKAKDKPADRKKPTIKKSLFSDALFRTFQKEYFGK
ncbi:active regulator of SIRT1 [Petromyzon marinus]|uniref:active regulator of SIRT1 n=1 Tax=Petromyzon marinus TaxID=7757 RepID=UPI003F72E6E2